MSTTGVKSNVAGKGFFDDENRMAGAGAGLMLGGGAYLLLDRFGNRKLRKEDKATQEQLSSLKSSVDRVNNVYENAFHPEKFQKTLKTNPNLNNLTVKDVEGLAERYYNNNISQEKTASANKFKFAQGLLGVGVPLAGAGLAVRNQAKKDLLIGIDINKKKIEENQRHLDKRKAGVPFKDYMANEYNLTSSDGSPYGKYSPSSLMGAFNHPTYGDPTYGADINRALKSKGIDYRNMNWNDYEKLVSQYATDVEKYDLTDMKSHANKTVSDYLNNKKKAFEIVDNAFSKISIEIDLGGI